MTGRRLSAAPLLVAVLAVLAVLTSAAPAHGGVASTVYRLSSDTRSAFRVSTVNRSRTTCPDGHDRPACRVATVDLSALPAAARARARAAIRADAASSLVAGVLAGGRSGAPARLLAERVWIAAGPRRHRATAYAVVDTGVRCIRAPCFSLRATTVNRPASASLSGLDLSAAGASPAELGRGRALLSRGGVLASGSIGNAPKLPGGRTLAATQLWLPA